MKNVLLKRTGFTLIELIVSLVLVVIVMLGLFSINSVLNNNNQDYGQRYLVKSETQDTLNHILNNSSLAVGSGTTINGMLDKGILIGSSPCNATNCGDLGVEDLVNNPNTFCIHQFANNNLTGATGDIWLCYTWYSSANLTYPNQIFYCTMPYNITSTPARGAVSCPYADAHNLCSQAGFNATQCTNSAYLGTAYAITNPVNSGTGPFYSPSTNPSIGFSITIQNCLTNSATGTEACSTSGTSGDQVNNPEVQISGSVFPSGEGT